MKALQSASYELKQKFPGSKRNVLFDDESTDLVLDFCLREGDPWRRMTARQARDRKKKSELKPGTGPNNFTLKDGELDGLLDSSVEETSNQE